MRTYYFLGLLSGILFLQSCKERYSGPTIAQGQVIDAFTNKGIAGAEVWLMRQSRESFSAIDRAHIHTAPTDEKGNFSFSFDTEDKYYYFLDAEAEHYYKDAEGGSIKSGEKNENMKVAIKPKGYIKFNIVNEEAKDTIEYRISGHFEPAIELYGFSRDTIIFRDVKGNVENAIIIRKRTNTGDEYLHNKLFVPAIDTVEYTIKY